MSSSTIFISCQRDDFDEASSNKEHTNTRAITKNTIDQILGMPINLKIPRLNHDWKDLSARQSEKKTCLYNKNNNSGKQ